MPLLRASAIGVAVVLTDGAIALQHGKPSTRETTVPFEAIVDLRLNELANASMQCLLIFVFAFHSLMSNVLQKWLDMVTRMRGKARST